jgi:pyridinium-3,5-biscarboxylic acid mononucleotide synthase
MDRQKLVKLLREYKQGLVKEPDMLKKLQVFPYKEMDFAKIDTQRSIKFGFPEVVYAPGKSIKQLVSIIEFILSVNDNIIITRVNRDTAEEIKKVFPEILYFKQAGILTVKKKKSKKKKYIAVICAGTSDISIAEEAAVTLEIMGDRVERIYDAGVAGLHRLIDKIEVMENASCNIVAAGMEGALPSVVGGLVSKPVIGIPTSVGYGSNLSGITPLLTMLNSCCPNVVVVNIDNGFGAAFFAHLIVNKS